ncbi:hypothetical protein BLA29_008433 [Euroglyphus maynei]|uniref:long-chain-fatty-acid--CoA ligase n=1 Tax=Euroglyphus maynei TaxID=6958 RepID=A0A1Y3AQ28_EURMA|nr:hypothetical protein BLA29_008433 [Euroglyphus maynei]
MHAAYAILNEEIIEEYDSHIYYAILPLAHILELIVESAFFGVGVKIERGFDTPMVNESICKRLNGNLGGKVQYMICGGAPLSPDTQRMMKAFLNVQILVGYGTSETCGGASLMGMHDLSIGNVGAPLKGVKVRLIDWPEGGYSVNDKPYPRGELVIGGKSIAKGYYKLPEKTEESFEEKDGIWWFKTGDIGEINKIGAIKIIDRKKDLIKLQFGEYISLGKVSIFSPGK